MIDEGMTDEALQRTRALILAAEFFAQCRDRRAELSADLARQVDEILTIFPSAKDIRYAAENFIKMSFNAREWLRPVPGDDGPPNGEDNDFDDWHSKNAPLLRR